jgi:heme-degrading monooxygenase HmoA
MTLEIAMFDIAEGHEDAFTESYQAARHLVADTEGCHSMRMTRGVETPTRFVLLVEWASLDAHQGFRDSDRFGPWREAVSPHFAGPPVVEHFEGV